MKVVNENSKVIQHKSFGMQQTCDHEQRALYKHDRDTKHERLKMYYK